MIMLDEAFPPQIESQLKLSDGLFLDLSGKGNTITNNGATLTTDHRGRANKAFTFSSLAYIQSNPNIDFIYGANGKFTCNVGFTYKDNGLSTGYLLSKSSGAAFELGFGIERGGNRDIRFTIYDNGANFIDTYIPSYVVEDGKYFITAVYDNASSPKMKFFMNGAYLGTNYMSGTFVSIENKSVPFIIGNSLGFPDFFFSASGMSYFSFENMTFDLSMHQQLYNEWRK